MGLTLWRTFQHIESASLYPSRYLYLSLALSLSFLLSFFSSALTFLSFLLVFYIVYLIFLPSSLMLSLPFFLPLSLSLSLYAPFRCLPFSPCLSCVSSHSPCECRPVPWKTKGVFDVGSFRDLHLGCPSQTSID